MLFNKQVRAMGKWLRPAGITFLAMLVIGGLTYHLVLRDWCLRWGTTEAEVHATLPVDDLFPLYTREATHVITIHVPTQQVWTWLMQIGQARGGLYSHTFLENLIGCGMPKVERLVPGSKLDVAEDVAHNLKTVRAQLAPYNRSPQRDLCMTSQQIAMCERLKRLGYSEGKRIRLYGQEFDLTSDPISLHERLVFVDGVERKSGAIRRIRIPLPIVQMITRDIRAA